MVAVPGGTVFALGTLLFALRAGAHPDYLGHYLLPNLLTGAGVGLSFAAFGSAAVAELPRNRYATGGAINNCVRQVGAVLGISTLIVVLGTPTNAALHDFHVAWTLMAFAGSGAALAGIALGRVRARHADEPIAVALAAEMESS